MEDLAEEWAAPESPDLVTTDGLPSKKPKKTRRVVVNVAFTKYNLVRQVAQQEFRWKLSRVPEDEEWDLLWSDTGIPPERLARMKLYQKINHFPGMFALARKNCLAQNLNAMQRAFPEAYDFYPATWLIPTELAELKQHATQHPGQVYIVKPEASCQGRGIYLTADVEKFKVTDRCVVQAYLDKPYLLEGLKFDLRLYVLVTGCDPLRVFIHEEGLVRFATEAYRRPDPRNFAKEFVHLTNYAINKHHAAYSRSQCGHKRTLSSLRELFASHDIPFGPIWDDISDLVLKTLCSVQPQLAHTYKLCQPLDVYNGMCFEILGFDVILDHTLKPWLLEVNHSPSFSTDSAVDQFVKFSVISQALRLVRVSSKFRKQCLAKKRLEIIRRSTFGKVDAPADREAKRAKAQQARDLWELRHLGNYQQIALTEACQQYIDAALAAWGGGARPRTRSAAPQPRAELPPRVAAKEMRRPVSPSFLERLSKPLKRDVQAGPIIYTPKRGAPSSRLQSAEPRGFDTMLRVFLGEQPMTIKSVMPEELAPYKTFRPSPVKRGIYRFGTK